MLCKANNYKICLQSLNMAGEPRRCFENLIDLTWQILLRTLLVFVFFNDNQRLFSVCNWQTARYLYDRHHTVLGFSQFRHFITISEFKNLEFFWHEESWTESACNLFCHTRVAHVVLQWFYIDTCPALTREDPGSATGSPRIFANHQRYSRRDICPF